MTDEAEQRERRELEEAGKAWHNHTPEYLIGFTEKIRAGRFHTPAIQEMQWRTIEATCELRTAVRASGDCTATQNAQMIKLTGSMKTLTWVVIGLAVVQIVIAIVIVTRGGA